MKKPFAILIWVLVALLALSILKDMVFKVAVEKGVEIVTGLRLNMRSFRVGLIGGVVSIKRLTLFNPPDFTDRVMLDMPKIYVACDLLSLMTGKLHLKKMSLDLKEFIVVKNERGELNLEALNVVREQEGKGPAKGKRARALNVQIDELHLKIGKAAYKDYSRGTTPSVREFNVNIDERYRDIRDPQALVSLIVVRALSNTSISGLAGFDLNGLKGPISDVLSSAQQVAAQAAGVAHQAAKKTVEGTGEVVKTTQEALKQTTAGLQDILKSPFETTSSDKK